MDWLAVVTGPPGAGKSTLSRALASRFSRSALVEGDAFFAFLAEGAVEPWLPSAREQNDVVIRAAAGAAGRFALGGYATVFDGVVGPWFLPTFASETGVDEYALLWSVKEYKKVRVRYFTPEWQAWREKFLEPA